MTFDKVGRLDEHAAQSADGVQDLPVVGLDDFDDELDDRGRVMNSLSFWRSEKVNWT
jgi:hypothetical protein